MSRAPQTCVLATLFYQLLFIVTSASSQFPVSSAACRDNYNLSSLANQTVASYEVQAPDGRRPLTILTILEAALNSSSREEIASRLNISMGCLDYLEFSLPEIALFLLNRSDFNEVTFDDVFRGVFVSEVESVLRSMLSLKSYLQSLNLTGNETLHEFAVSNNLSIEAEPILEIFLQPFNVSDVRILSLFLEVSLSSFDLLNRTTRELATILAVKSTDEIGNYTLIHLVKISYLGRGFINGLQITIREVRASLHVSWIEISEELGNVTSVLKVVLSKVPRRVRYLSSYIIGYDVSLLNVTLQEIAELTNQTVIVLQVYKVYPQLVSFIIKTRKKIIDINGETRKEIIDAIEEILEAYNVTFLQLGEAFNLTVVQIRELSPLKIEQLCARYTLLRYVTNLNLTLAEVAIKVNRSQAELSYNLTVKDFHVVIRKLVIVHTFEVMSRMLGVSQDFLVNSLNINVPLSSLSMCQLDSFLKITRHTVLSLRDVITKKSLAFVVHINGYSINFVYKLTIEQFIIRVMHLNVREFFALNGLNYSYSAERLGILTKYHFVGLERLFQIHEDIPNNHFCIFRYSLAWIINRIIFLVETDRDECREGNDRCHRLSQCINLPGTYECICPPKGYAGRYCEDINECEDGTAVCPQDASCLNTPGSYRCECNIGFSYNATNNTCDDINECDSIFDNNCYWGGLTCINTVGSYLCRCPDGYYYDNRYRRCRDINECLEDPCSSVDANAVCVDSAGSYDCLCRRGFEPYYNNSVSPRVLVNCTDIDECAGGQEICPKNSECVNTLGSAYCRCLPGYQLKRGKCRAKRFIPFIWRWILSFKKRKCEKVKVPSGFPYFGKLHKKIYICHNGLVSIGKKYYRANPRSLKDLRKNVIAVFWANTDITVFSSIDYQVVDRSTPEFREQLDNVSDVIRNCSGAYDFNATWMIIIRWEKVSPYARFFFFNPYAQEQSTYQLVLVTNGTHSYAIYTYEDGGMEWTSRLRRRCAVGYAAINGENKYSYQEDDSFDENIFSIDSKEFDVNGVKRRGFFCKSLNTPDEPVRLTDEQRCMNWYNSEPDPDSWLEELSDCPATRRAARRDNRYRRVSKSKDIYCYELRFPTRVYGASHQCCYYKRGRRNNAFVSEPPFAGRAYRHHYRHERLRQLSDIEPFQACCNEADSTLCTLFYEKRPLTTAASITVFPLPCTCRFLAFGCRGGRSCSRRRRPRRPFRRFILAWFFGDPHISTLDGWQYTFNGLGDYVLIRTRDSSLHLHGRTKRPLTSDGELTNATVFSGFVLKTNDSDTAQIFFDDSLPGNLSITVLQENSCTNHTIDYFDQGRDFTGMSIERSSVNNNTVIVSFPSGFSIEVTPGIGLLQITISTDEDMMNNTQGLMGTFNGDKTDDLQYPNGTTISANSTEEEIFHLGQKWRVPDGKRLFVSSNCTLENVFFDDAFVPSFLNESAITPGIRALCGDNRECIYDVLTTGNVELGKQTAGFEEENQNLVNELDNTPPEISGPDEVNVTLNEKTHFYITSTDADNDTVTLDIEELPPGANFNSSTGHFEWTPINATNITLEFIATDTKNASTVLTVVVNMCKCENNGECDFTEFVGDSTGSFRVVGCNCSEQYEGTFCETEILDACADEPCYDNVTCTSQSNPYGFQCGPCPAGLTGDGQNCYETDECANASVSRCNQTCVNTFGSFRCECRHGFESREEGRICEDINECQEVGRHNCTENAECTNLPGSFNCSCRPGYEGDPYSNCTDKDECNNGEALCSQGCVDTPGSYRCTCKNGFQLSSNQATCEDINECATGHNCERICENVIGSYKCRCPPGLELNANNITCKVAEGSACDDTNGGCSQICVNRTGLVTCYCNPGYNLTNDDKTCEDINECMTANHGCNQNCSNNNGSYECGCYAGYQLDADQRTCIDVNECASPGLNNCSQICENTEGSYQCSCEDGFNLEPDNTSCADINECTSGPGGCSAGSCVNVPGSFQCQCPLPLFFAEGKCRGARVFVISLTIGQLNGVPVVWKASFSNPRSLDFGFLARRLEKQINWFFRRRFRGRFYQAIVGRFRRGSVIADVDLNFAENATEVSENALENELPLSGKMGNLTYDPQTAKISEIDECAHPGTHNCYSNANCENTPGSFECKCKEGYQGDGVNSCDPAPGTVAPEDDKNELVIIICAVVFGALLLIIIVGIYCYHRNKRYKGEIGEPRHSSISMASRSVRSDVYFHSTDKEGKTGSYDVSPEPESDSGDGMRSRVSSGAYDYADPFPGGERTTHYENAGLEKDSAL